MKRVCKQCGKTFELSGSEIAFYKSRNLNLPKRCKACRQANKQSRDVSEEQDLTIQRLETDMPERRSMPGQRGIQEWRAPEQQGNKVGKWVYVLIVASLLLLFGLIGVSNRIFSPDDKGSSVRVENESGGLNGQAETGRIDSEAPPQENAADAEEIPQKEEADIQEIPQKEEADTGEIPQKETADAAGTPQKEEADTEETPQKETADTAETPQNEAAGIEETAPLQEAAEGVKDGAAVEKHYTFRNDELLQAHFEKHGKEMGFSSAEAYQAAADAVVNNAGALHKTEKEDGDDVYYLEATNEFVIVSTDGFIRTYFYPNAGIDYYNRQ